jgi:hypothetical protein
MDATPAVHVVVLAVAEYCTLVLTVAPFDGLLTITVANADALERRNTSREGKNLFIKLPLRDS